MAATGRCRLVSCFAKGDKLGEGTYGSVYQARDKETGRLVALKRVKEKTFEREGMPQTSLREIALLRKLKHPNIVSLIEVVVGSKADSIFLVFEYCGFELAQLVDSLPSAFPFAEIKCVIRQLLGAVAHMHANGVIHRDLKLSNLLLSDRKTSAARCAARCAAAAAAAAAAISRVRLPSPLTNASTVGCRVAHAALADGALKLCDFGLARSSTRPLPMTIRGRATHLAW